jgi:hypothetical protein
MNHHRRLYTFVAPNLLISISGQPKPSMDVHASICERRGEVTGYVDEREGESRRLLPGHCGESEKAEERERMHHWEMADAIWSNEQREREEKKGGTRKKTETNVVFLYF